MKKDSWNAWCLANPAVAELLKVMIAYENDPSRLVWSQALVEPTNIEDRRDYAEKVLAIAKANRSGDVVEEALIWLIGVAPAYFDTSDADRIIEKDYLQSENLAALCWNYILPPHTASKEHLLSQLINESPHERVRAHALFCLAASKLSTDPELAKQLFKKVSEEYSSIEAVEPRDSLELFSKAGAAWSVEPKVSLVLASVVEQIFRPFPLGSAAQQCLFELEHLSVGAQAQPTIGTDADGKVMKLDDYRGKIVMLVFFGDWCQPCRSMYPHEWSLVQQFKSQPFTIVGVNSDPADLLKKIIEEKTVQWPCFWDGGSNGGPIASQWQVQAWPTVYILDDKGVIRFTNPPRDLEGLSKCMTQLLAEMKH